MLMVAGLKVQSQGDSDFLSKFDSGGQIAKFCEWQSTANVKDAGVKFKFLKRWVLRLCRQTEEENASAIRDKPLQQ
jgi:hypothetical protein